MKNHPLKIVLVTTTDLMAGAEKNIYDLLLHLDRTRYVPYLVVLKNDPNGALVQKAQSLGVETYSVGIQSKWQIFRLVRLWGLLRRIRPDILESFLFFDNIVCRIFGRILCIPVVISGQQNVETQRTFLRAEADRLTIGLADAVISNTDAGKRLYVDRGYLPAERIVVAKNGVDLGALREKQAAHVRQEPRVLFGRTVPSGTFAILSVGFLTEQKGMRYLIEAAAELAKRNVKIECFIIGSGILRSELELLSRKSGVSDTIHFVGFQKESFQYVHLFDAFVLPSLWEGLPNVIIEALASRVPVIATDVGGVGEVIASGETGILVPPGKPLVLADAIEHLIVMPDHERQAMIDAAYGLVVSELTVDAMVRTYITCYESLYARTHRD